MYCRDKSELRTLSVGSEIVIALGMVQDIAVAAALLTTGDLCLDLSGGVALHLQEGGHGRGIAPFIVCRDAMA